MKVKWLFMLFSCHSVLMSAAFADGELQAMLDFYRSHSVWTEPGKYRSLYDGIPEGIDGTVKAVQNVLMHGGLVQFYGLQPSEPQKGGQNIRRTEELLERISRLDGRPLRQARTREARLLVNCRQFAVLTCSILRQKGVPARARAGYGLYLGGSIRYENHWICEYWSEKDRRWIQVDAQIDDTQRRIMGINFNTLDMPRGNFASAGEGWNRYREGKVPIEFFGVFGNSLGWSMVMPNVICDNMALNKDEFLPWDTPPYWDKKQSEMSAEDMNTIQKLADYDWNTETNWRERRAFYNENATLRMPADFEKEKQE